MQSDEVAEWLRRWTANPLGSARVGSNPILVEEYSFVLFSKITAVLFNFTTVMRPIHCSCVMLAMVASRISLLWSERRVWHR